MFRAFNNCVHPHNCPSKPDLEFIPQLWVVFVWSGGSIPGCQAEHLKTSPDWLKGEGLCLLPTPTPYQGGENLLLFPVFVCLSSNSSPTTLAKVDLGCFSFRLLMDLLPTNCVLVARVCFLLELLHMSEENGFMARNLPDNNPNP